MPLRFGGYLHQRKPPAKGHRDLTEHAAAWQIAFISCNLDRVCPVRIIVITLHHDALSLDQLSFEGVCWIMAHHAISRVALSWPTVPHPSAARAKTSLMTNHELSFFRNHVLLFYSNPLESNHCAFIAHYLSGVALASSALHNTLNQVPKRARPA